MERGERGESGGQGEVEADPRSQDILDTQQHQQQYIGWELSGNSPSFIFSSYLVLITLVYWSALYTPEKHVLDFENFSGHLLICVSCVLDVWISDRPWRLSHALHPILYGSVFGVFSLAFHFLKGRNYHFEPYIYYILDWNKPFR